MSFGEGLLLKVIDRCVRSSASRMARLELLGYRPEALCVALRSSNNKDEVLLVRHRASPDFWTFPQEGIDSETVESATVRCLRVEVGLLETQIQFRRSLWLGKVRLPELRHGERDLPGSFRNLMGKPGMIGKGYYGTLSIVEPNAEVKVNPAEVLEAKWVPAAETLSLVSAPNDAKQLIVRTCTKALISTVNGR